MVALFKEGNIAPRLIRRLERLDYPRDLLDILLVVEEEDSLTRNALKAVEIPPWVRVIVVPDGPLKTKPRALNFGLVLRIKGRAQPDPSRHTDGGDTARRRNHSP